jgi:hypothetical protein
LTKIKSVSSSSLIDKNGHKRTVYVRIDKQESKVKREPWDSSTEKAKNLKISDFGTLDEVWEMAKMEWEANTREEARSFLVGLINKPLKSKAGIAATVSKNSIEKILSGKSTDKSYDAKAHFLAAANHEILFPKIKDILRVSLIKGAGTLAPGAPSGSSVAPLSCHPARIHLFKYSPGPLTRQALFSPKVLSSPKRKPVLACHSTAVTFFGTNIGYFGFVIISPYHSMTR